MDPPFDTTPPVRSIVPDSDWLVLDDARDAVDQAQRLLSDLAVDAASFWQAIEAVERAFLITRDLPRGIRARSYDWEPRLNRAVPRLEQLYEAFTTATDETTRDRARRKALKVIERVAGAGKRF